MQKLSRRRVAEYAAGQLMKHESPMKLANYLAAYLAENKQIAQADMLLEDIEEVLASRHGVVMAEITSARPLSEALRAISEALVAKSHKAKKVIMVETIDPELIGGITIKTPTGYFDGSLRNKLKNLQGMKEAN
ncbi:H+-transporting two-sector ATPase, delta (OSCP) subunit [candidate division TM7 genomosp. GTL1]|nr:H+-transporting two-sector ATPase, delta (OSCP) subunit [candidate division TM7 genomosp. GTL1]